MRIVYIRLYERGTKNVRNLWQAENQAVYAEPWHKRKALFQELIVNARRAVNAWYLYDPNVLLDIVEETHHASGRVTRKVIS